MEAAGTVLCVCVCVCVCVCHLCAFHVHVVQRWLRDHCLTFRDRGFVCHVVVVHEQRSQEHSVRLCAVGVGVGVGVGAVVVVVVVVCGDLCVCGCSTAFGLRFRVSGFGFRWSCVRHPGRPTFALRLSGGFPRV